MTEAVTPPSREAYGRIVATCGVAALPDQAFVQQCLGRFLAQDWGTLDDHDQGVNRETLARKDGGTVMGAYQKAGLIIWIICAGYGNSPEDADACYTTILLPEEY